MSLPTLSGSLPREPVFNPSYYLSSPISFSSNKNNMSGLLSLGAAGVGAVGNVISGLFSGHQNRKENRRNRQFAHDEAVLAHNRQLEIMDKQNQYNSPANQRALMEAAGFSPWSISDGLAGTITSSGASGGAQASNPSSHGMQPVDFSGLMNVLQAQMMQAQIKRTNAETNKLGTETDGQKIVNSLNAIEVGLQKKFGAIERLVGINRADAERAFADARRYAVGLSMQLDQYSLHNILPAQRNVMIADAALKSQDVAYKKILSAKTDAERESIVKNIGFTAALTFSTIRLNNAKINNLFAQSQLYKDQSNYYSGLSRLNGQQFDIRKMLWNDKNSPGYVSARSNANIAFNNALLSHTLFHDSSILNAYKYSFERQLRANGMKNDVEITKLGSTFYNALKTSGELLGPFIPLAPGYSPSSSNQGPMMNGYNPYTTDFSVGY